MCCRRDVGKHSRTLQREKCLPHCPRQCLPPLSSASASCMVDDEDAADAPPSPWLILQAVDLSPSNLWMETGQQLALGRISFWSALTGECASGLRDEQVTDEICT